MNTSNMVLKTRLSEILDTLNLIILLYSIFLVGFGLKLHNSEVIVETCIMFVVYIIFEYLNYDLTHITIKGIKSGKYGNISWKEIYRIKRKENLIYIYTKEREKPYKIIISKSEDKQEVSRAYKYMISKIKTPDKVKSIKDELNQ